MVYFDGLTLTASFLSGVQAGAPCRSPVSTGLVLIDQVGGICFIK